MIFITVKPNIIAELTIVFINGARNTEDTAKVYFEKYQCKLNICVIHFVMLFFVTFQFSFLCINKCVTLT